MYFTAKSLINYFRVRDEQHAKGVIAGLSAPERRVPGDCDKDTVPSVDPILGRILAAAGAERCVCALQ
jgi:hypothetical protein